MIIVQPHLHVVYVPTQKGYNQGFSALQILGTTTSYTMYSQYQTIIASSESEKASNKYLKAASVL